MVDANLRKLVRQNLEVLFRSIDNRQGAFSKLKYTSYKDIFDEPAIRESNIDRFQAEATFMARRFQQAMPLSAAMSSIEEHQLHNIIEDVGRWKDRTGYLYNHDENFPSRETPDGSDVKIISSMTKDYFESLDLKNVSSNKDSGYLTWRGNKFLTEIDVRLTFDIRIKYGWRMRFSIGIFSKNGTLICNVSDWEIFGKIIYAVVEINFDSNFEYCDTRSHNFMDLGNYLSITGLTLNEIMSWKL
ncbi:hypothetical protein EN829_011305 [Mesorhizobium sp. M00.F.Ca.ET.186.01.1.1]|nr:hypothetical protein EN848_06860 [bacterium M00.F.Ca.ET.205.01.1.1]TGU53782.1 hypothetical protein EN795_11280 [bacterium M00.F.Ca.ET.152.01.1.1]TGV37280.1 hypothetical protein EN829_011305 [Mesorhizobium sp. M00.F.Ca.ET.186.01.1.1]TGZ38606.1 hypothetical protein EN805_32955 [bacterium M00.F.Ca.ET.162.01.1.1]TIW59443.1 MAG: hypothetical protein E5V48_17790 [Mesorhizobium sp.]